MQRYNFFYLKIHFSKIIIFFSIDPLFRVAVIKTCAQRGGGFTQAGVPQRFGRAINFQIPTKLSAGIHHRLRETARCVQAFFYHFYSIP